MSKQNLELIRGLYAGSPSDWVAAFADESFMQAWESALESLLDAEFELRFITDGTPAGLPGLEETYRGIEGFKLAYRNWLQTWETYRAELDELIDLGDRIVALSHWGGRTKTGRVELFQPGAEVWTVRDGKVRKLESYMDRNRALEATGLSP
jgi:ketosteroid isomerase-like protein